MMDHQASAIGSIMISSITRSTGNDWEGLLSRQNTGWQDTTHTPHRLELLKHMYVFVHRFVCSRCRFPFLYCHPTGFVTTNNIRLTRLFLLVTFNQRSIAIMTFRSRRKTPEWLSKIPGMARQVEAVLFRRAHSLEAYMDVSTLDHRVVKVFALFYDEH